jgi:hypothetical protein
MVKSAENRMCSNLELLPVIHVKSRPRYISALLVIWIWNQNIAISTIVGTSSHINIVLIENNPLGRSFY